MGEQMDTVWVLGDQLNRSIGALAQADPSTHRVLMVESSGTQSARRYHRQRLHLVVTAMQRFAAALRGEGFAVDYREAASFVAGLAAHRRDHGPGRVLATEALSRRAEAMLRRNGVELVRSNQFLCHRTQFARWAEGRSSLVMEHFYRHQRRRLGYLMDGEEPAEGRWNFDEDNREPPPDGNPWPEPPVARLGDLDEAVLAKLPDSAFGADPRGWWATDRAGALARLEHFVADVLPGFGPHEDAMTTRSWHLAHSLLSPYLNLGLLLPGEVCDAVDAAYRRGHVPIASAEGFIRQVIGWREFIWGVYWLRPELEHANALGNERSLPPAFAGEAPTRMRCLAEAVAGIEQRGWLHHIQRLMILANLANLCGVVPRALTEWMRASFVDAADWVMVPNVAGLAMWADGGGMATKPYVSGGAYVDRMSDYCGDCPFDPKQRTGERACPFTTLYWDFLARNRERLTGNRRMALPLRSLERLGDLAETRVRAEEVLGLLEQGRL
jgi:deoxyribodipyrimidine photolyase-related protein